MPALLPACSPTPPTPRPAETLLQPPRQAPGVRRPRCSAALYACAFVRARGGGGDPGAPVPTPTLRLIIVPALCAREQARGTVRAGVRLYFGSWGGGARELARGVGGALKLGGGTQN